MYVAYDVSYALVSTLSFKHSAYTIDIILNTV